MARAGLEKFDDTPTKEEIFPQKSSEKKRKHYIEIMIGKIIEEYVFMKFDVGKKQKGKGTSSQQLQNGNCYIFAIWDKW